MSPASRRPAFTSGSAARRNAPTIFFEGASNLVKDPAGWMSGRPGALTSKAPPAPSPAPAGRFTSVGSVGFAAPPSQSPSRTAAAREPQPLAAPTSFAASNTAPTGRSAAPSKKALKRAKKQRQQKQSEFNGVIKPTTPPVVLAEPVVDPPIALAAPAPVKQASEIAAVPVAAQLSKPDAPSAPVPPPRAEVASIASEAASAASPDFEQCAFQLESLKKLLEGGVLTQAEFDAKKADILERM